MFALSKQLVDTVQEEKYLQVWRKCIHAAYERGCYNISYRCSLIPIDTHEQIEQPLYIPHARRIQSPLTILPSIREL